MIRTSIKLVVASAYLFSLASLQAESKTKSFDFNKVQALYCYDGDTCTFNILDSNFPSYLNPMSIRFARIDTKEMKSKNPYDKALAVKAKEFTNSFVKNASVINLSDCKKGKYFRFVCEVSDENNTNLNDLLLNKGLAEVFNYKN